MNLSLAKFVDRWGGIAACRVLAGLRTLREMIAPRTGVVEVRTILCIKFWGLGNIVLLLPVLRLLRERYPEARIVFVSLARNREILDACPHVDRRIYVDDRGPLRLLATYIAAAFRGWREGPDLAIDFEQFARASAILAVLARSKQIAGLATPGQGRAILYHKLVRYDDTQHMGRTYLDLARAAGVAETEYRPEPFAIGDAARRERDALLGGARPAVAAGPHRPLVVIHPGSGDNFQGRRWPAQNFARLADRAIRERGARVVVTGSPGEAALVREVVARMEEPSQATDAAGRLSVLGLGALLESADALVTNDTAPVHMGSALGIGVFALYGPNTPVLYGPLSPGSHGFYRALPCSPCLTNMNYKTSHCRLPVCIQDIGVNEVWARVAAHLDLRAAADRAGAAGTGTSRAAAASPSAAAPGPAREA
jgi:heptosyltransferase-3